METVRKPLNTFTPSMLIMLQTNREIRDIFLFDPVQIEHVLKQVDDKPDKRFRVDLATR